MVIIRPPPSTVLRLILRRHGVFIVHTAVVMEQSLIMNVFFAREEDEENIIQILDVFFVNRDKRGLLTRPLIVQLEMVWMVMRKDRRQRRVERNKALQSEWEKEWLHIHGGLDELISLSLPSFLPVMHHVFTREEEE